MQDNHLHINEKFNIKLTGLKLQQQFYTGGIDRGKPHRAVMAQMKNECL